MYDVFYIDVYILVNTLMDFFILSILKALLRSQAPYWRIFLGSLLGASLSGVILVLPQVPQAARSCMVHMGVNLLMLKAGLGMRGAKALARGMLLLYAVAFLFGGAIGWLGETGMGSGRLLLCAFAAFVLIRAVYSILRSARSDDKNIYSVTISLGEGQSRAQGLLDTGNRLVEPYLRRPVCVAEYELLSGLLGQGENKIRYIPYQSVGNPSGLMPVVTVDEMLIEGEQGPVCRKNVVVGMVRERLSPNGRYQVILHPELMP